MSSNTSLRSLTLKNGIKLSPSATLPEDASTQFSWFTGWLSTIVPDSLQKIEIGIEAEAKRDLAGFPWVDVDVILSSFPVLKTVSLTMECGWLTPELPSDDVDLLAAIAYVEEHLPLVRAKGVAVGIILEDDMPEIIALDSSDESGSDFMSATDSDSDGSEF